MGILTADKAERKKERENFNVKDERIIKQKKRREN